VPGDFSATDPAARNVHFGVREHAAGAIANGLALSKIRAYQAGFLIFSDFQRGALRLSALMELPVIHMYTHDSIGVGEDGPTHQPVENLASLRAMPGLIDLRPGDANEVVEAWRLIMPLRHDPVALIPSRQAMPTLDRTVYAPASGLARGGYILAGDPDTTPDMILIASGSEGGPRRRRLPATRRQSHRRRVHAVDGTVRPPKPGVPSRRAARPRSPPGSSEQGSAFGLDRWAGATGEIIAMSTFGASAPLKALQTKFGFTSERVIEAAKNQLV
jgi:transketolase